MRILIVEDEAMVAARLERLTREILGDRLASLHVLSTFGSARAFLATHPIDVLLLDLNLGGRDGFALLEEAVAGAFATIVVSAHHDGALRAFELGVTDFVPKPFGRERLARALARIDDREAALRRRLRRLAVRRGGGRRVDLVEVDEICYVRGAGDYSALHTQNGDVWLHDKSLTLLEQVLPPRFARLHRSYVIDLDRVKALRSQSGGKHWVVLSDGTELPVSRAKIDDLRHQLATE
ncbi:MAG: LytTR family DNA-binding domain-containing protein [Acidobacteriota bacterium]